MAIPDARFLHPEAIVSTAWLAANLDLPNLRMFDCTTYLLAAKASDRPYEVASGRADFDAAHIAGSGFVDLQGQLSDPASPYSFTMPAPDILAAALGGCGVGDGHRIVLYSRKSPMWATRLWWMLRAIGFDDAAILDGGWDKWVAEGRPISAAPCRYAPTALTPRPRPGLFVGKEAVRAAIGDDSVCTINALSAESHRGAAARYGRAGRVPGSVNVPAGSLIDPLTLELPSPERAAAAFAAAGVAPTRRVIAYCGGGIAATLDAFLLHQLGWTDIAVYDNSMSEWARDDSLPMETG